MSSPWLQDHYHVLTFERQRKGVYQQTVQYRQPGEHKQMFLCRRGKTGFATGHRTMPGVAVVKRKQFRETRGEELGFNQIEESISTWTRTTAVARSGPRRRSPFRLRRVRVRRLRRHRRLRCRPT